MIVPKINSLIACVIHRSFSNIEMRYVNWYLLFLKRKNFLQNFIIQLLYE